MAAPSLSPHPASPSALKALFDQKAEAARKRPEEALHRTSAWVRSAFGLACDVEHTDRTMRVDLPRGDGGGASGPHPGQLLRASLGACLIMGIKLWAARLGVPLGELTLRITCDYDVRGQLGVDDGVPVGWKSVHFDLDIESSAPKSDVLHVIDTARRQSPMLANLSPAVARTFDVRIADRSDASSTEHIVP